MGAVCSLLTRDDDDWVSRAVAFDKAYQEHQESFVIVDQPTIQLPPQASLRLVPPSPSLSAPRPLSKMASNPLISAQKSADSGLQVALHPLVLLTISDYITRHTLRQQEGPVVGALLGQQNGREITIEHAFECLLIEHGGDVILSQAWFEERLQQMKDVHKVPQLDLVGWYTIMPIAGPQPVHLPIHQQILDNYNESAILLGFHPTAVVEGTAGGKLPLTIYESKLETEGTADGDSGEDKEMKDGEAQQVLKFKELPYSVETGEAEMISVDFVARGGGNATAIDSKPQKPAPESKGKQKEEAQVSGKDAGKLKESDYLTREEEELIATLTAKANAIKMLHARISLIATYLQSLPPSFISDSAPEGEENESKKYTPVNHSILRSVQALLTRLSLLVPADAAAFEKELLSEQNDVELVKLLSSLTQSIKDVRQTGRKFGVVREGKASKNSSNKHVWGGGAAPGSYEQGSGVMGVGDLMN